MGFTLPPDVLGGVKRGGGRGGRQVWPPAELRKGKGGAEEKGLGGGRSLMEVLQGAPAGPGLQELTD